MHVAELGVFNHNGLTPIESAGRTNLYEFMNYLSYKTAESKLNEPE